MTISIDGIIYNSKRLLIFLNYRTEFRTSQEPESFLEEYSRIMDIHGTGKEQYSLLLLTDQDFEAVKTFGANQYGFYYKEAVDKILDGYRYLSKEHCSFTYLGYIWHLKKVNDYPELSAQEKNHPK